MAGLIIPDNRTATSYRGLDSIFEYTNGDGKLCRANCGQAATATILTHSGKFVGDIMQARHIMAAIERAYPPDQLGGLFGTGRRGVERICRAFGFRLREVRDEQSFRDNLTQRRPVIVMLGVSAGRLWNRLNVPGGHWMVAYGFDGDHVYLTNHGKMTWDEFRAGWNSLVPRLIRMDRRGLVIKND